MPNVVTADLVRAVVVSLEGSSDPEDVALAQRLKDAAGAITQAQFEPSVLASPDDRVASILQASISEAIDAEPEGLEGLQKKFDHRDLGWIRWVAARTRAMLGNRLEQPWPPASPDPLPQKARIAVLGDWGSGMYGAIGCARSIERDLAPPEAVIHLGDIYYAGTVDEAQTGFVEHWPQIEAIGRACNANHEMASGGAGLFTKVLPFLHQQSTMFAFQNENWLLVGLDTAFREGTLDDRQLGWLGQLLRDHPQRRLILFSHHYPFSQFATGPRQLLGKLQAVAAEHAPVVWYWGHEHRLVLYDPLPGSGLIGRCAGHSGYPERAVGLDSFPKEVLPAGHQFRLVTKKRGVPRGHVLEGPPPPGLGRGYGPHGYVVLELDGPNLTERFYSHDGTLIFTAS